MAILENIRKRTTVLILIIGLALFAFVISGVFSSDNFSGAGNVGSAVAEVNGTEISRESFARKMEQASRAYGANMSSTQLVNMVWNQELQRTILGQEVEGLGIDIQSDQIVNYIAQNPGFSQNPEYLDANGVFSEARFKESIARLREDAKSDPNANAQYQFWLQQEKAIIQSAREQVYYNMIKAGVGATLKEGELDYHLANDKVDIQYVRVPYSSIADSTITVDKSEIEAYIAKHASEFEQENARDIQLVYFEDKPSLEDENAVKTAISALLDDKVEGNENIGIDTIQGFKNVADVAAFLDTHSDEKYDTIYKQKTTLPSQFADTLMALPVGETFGPYRDGDFFKVSRMMGRKANGAVKASHILIAWEGAERAYPSVTRTKEEAELKAKEMLAEAKKSDAVFATLARDNSDGPSAPRGGDLGYFQEGMMTDVFNDFAFQNPVDHVGMVETEFGYHIVHVDDKQDIVQVATLSREIEASEETNNKLFTDATTFEMSAVEGKGSFLDLAKESSYTVLPVNKLKEMDENLPGLGSQRGIVSWAFNEETSVGDIKKFNVNNGYAIAQVTRRYNKGTMSAEDASSRVLPRIRKEKKAAQIIAANQGKAFEDFASANNVSVANATAVTVKSPTIPGAGREPMVIGTAHALADGATSGLIEGETGVFLVKVTKKEVAPALDNYSTYANTLQTSAANGVNGRVFQALKNAADIEDKRVMFY
jgi:peptidyl-prolyl cis-trans isomerase D